MSWNNGEWTGTPLTRREQALSKQVHICSNDLFRDMTDQLEVELGLDNAEGGRGRTTLTFFAKVSYLQKIGSLTRRRYLNHTFQPGDFIHCYTEASLDAHVQIESRFIRSSDDGLGKKIVMCVHCILGASIKSVWAIVVQGRPYSTPHCDSANDDRLDERAPAFSHRKEIGPELETGSFDSNFDRPNVYTFPVITQSLAKIVKLTSTVRKEFGLYACDLYNSNGIINTSQTILSNRIPRKVPAFSLY